jgi:hypothetical protein
MGGGARRFAKEMTSGAVRRVDGRVPWVRGWYMLI